MTPHECIKEAIANKAAELDDSAPKDKQLFELADAVLQYLDAEGYTVIDVDAAWKFHDRLQQWLNQDYDGHRINTFGPYDDWLEVWKRLPPRRRYDAAGQLIS